MSNKEVELIDTVENVETEDINTIVEENEEDIDSDEEEMTDFIMGVVNTLFFKLNKINIPINLNNIPTIMKYSMETVEDLAQDKLNTVLKRNKKKYAIQIVKYLIHKTQLDNKTKSLCLELLSGSMLDDLVEIIVKASKGDLQLNKETIEDVVELSQKCCFSFFKKRNNNKK